MSIGIEGARILFFFRQKTAYDIGLGIPAEPLFRSDRPFIAAVIAYYVHPVNIQTACLIMEGAEFTERSEERRVGKEGRSRWAPEPKKTRYIARKVRTAT